MQVTLEMIKEAQRRLDGVIRKTELSRSYSLSQETGMNVYLKTENRQNTNSFKLRGAYNKIASLTDEERKRGVVASSAGNHAQGVAFAAKTFGINATICMPETAPKTKVESTKSYGATVVQYGQVYDDCYQKAVEIQKETGATFIHPFNDPYVIAGQGTIGLEILDVLNDVDAVVVPIGGGGIISGIAIAIKEIKPSVKIIGVQAEVIASTKASLDAGKIVTLPGVKSLADGISVKTPGDLTFEIIKKYVDDVVTVSEEEIEDAIYRLLRRSKLVVEGAGATTVAAVVNGKVNMPGKNVVCVLTGGNIDPIVLANIILKKNS
ncbi:L-threonine ammonia-lyase [Caloramator fervidus]|uniref:L-threonine dehydratase catabolic TdcB n=1 Tax=Caloramator fervidus TaxID=29344 RepID=A0A1H5XSQ5_9CLOT|nr:threonine ammonia-lyase [Caloramator fervidus]SEG14692.1 L-threonine ammonia-lyase [Caloramator fervidus]